MPSEPLLTLVHSIGETLDGLDVALCAFDDDDCCIAWNRTFFKFFPEHEGQVYAGEPYRANLRRFYSKRLDAQELPNIERYIAAGLERHRAQTRPYSFEHRGLRVHVSSLPVAGVGRLRVWRAETLHVQDAMDSANIHEPGFLRSPVVESAELFDRIPDGLMICAGDQRIQWVNEPFMLMYGLTDRATAAGLAFDEIYQMAWAGARGAGDMSQFYEGLSVLQENMRFAGAPFEVPLPRSRWARVIAKQGSDGTVFYAHVDITDFKRQQRLLAQAERSARDSEAQLREKSIVLEATLENMDQGVAKISASGVVELCNRRALELLDLPHGLMSSRPTLSQVLTYLRARGEFELASQEVQDFLQDNGGLDHLHVYDRPRPDGRVVEVQTIPINGGGALRTFTDITVRKQAEQRIRHVAEHDGLTSLLNRAAFLQALQAAVTGVRHQGRGFAVLYVDLDGFKPVNDQFGHAVGDQVLVCVASRLSQVAREDDVVARLGGDEFALLQRGVSDRDSASRLAQRLVEAVAQPIEVESRVIDIGASVGIVMSPADGVDAEELLRKADSAMYLAKAKGRGCARMYGT